MPATIWDAVMAAVAARLRAVITDVPLDTDRRAPVAEAECPRLTLTLGDVSEDLTMAPGEALHRIEVVLRGYATGTTDTACRVALNTMLARAVGALNGWQSGAIFDVQAGPDRRVMLYDAEESARAMGEFTQGFIAQSMTPAGAPYDAP